MRSSIVLTAVPGQLPPSGQFSHHVVEPPPPTGEQLPALQALFSCTVPPSVIVHSSRVVAAMQELPIPTRQTPTVDPMNTSCCSNTHPLTEDACMASPSGAFLN